jgi:F-type H+-transporting ATPase subunit delta
MSYIAFQYAEALFALAHEEKQVESVLESFKGFVKAQDFEISKFLNHPKVTKKAKKEVLSKAITNSLFKNFIFVLIDNSRIDYLDDCLDEYQVIVDAQNKIMNVFVYSSKKLTKTETQELVNNLSKKHNRKVKLENIVDKTILGGLRIEFEGNILDETINNYLATLRNNLTK